IRERRRRTDINLDESHSHRPYLIERRMTYTVIFIIGNNSRDLNKKRKEKN
ncbi:unnamed protein product, partial [Rotaria sp. Silwood1]